MNGTVSWFLLFVFALLLIILGFSGSMGKMMAVIFTPSMLRNLDDVESFQ